MNTIISTAVLMPVSAHFTHHNMSSPEVSDSPLGFHPAPALLPPTHTNLLPGSSFTNTV